MHFPDLSDLHLYYSTNNHAFFSLKDSFQMYSLIEKKSQLRQDDDQLQNSDPCITIITKRVRLFTTSLPPFKTNRETKILDDWIGLPLLLALLILEKRE